MDYVIFKLIHYVFQFLYLALLVRVLLSWIPNNPYHPIIQFIHQITDPILKPFQDIIPSYRIGIDLSPLFAFLALNLLERLIFGLF